MKKYKSVNKDLSSKYDPKFKYKVGKTFEVEADKSQEECSTGLHCSGIIYANGYDWKEDQKIIEVEVEEKDIVFKGENKFRCKRLKVNKILTEKQIDNQLEKEFTEKFGKKGLWRHCQEFRNKEFLTKKLTIQDKKKIKKLLLNTNKKLKKYDWNYTSNVRFIQVYSLGSSLLDSLGCKLSKEHDSDLLDDLIEVFRMGYLVAGKDKEGNWLVVASKDKKFKECII